MYHKHVYMMVFITVSHQCIILTRNPNSKHSRTPGTIFPGVFHLEEPVLLDRTSPGRFALGEALAESSQFLKDSGFEFSLFGV